MGYHRRWDASNPSLARASREWRVSRDGTVTRQSIASFMHAQRPVSRLKSIPRERKNDELKAIRAIRPTSRMSFSQSLHALDAFTSLNHPLRMKPGTQRCGYEPYAACRRAFHPRPPHLYAMIQVSAQLSSPPQPFASLPRSAGRNQASDCRSTCSARSRRIVRRCRPMGSVG